MRIGRDLPLVINPYVLHSVNVNNIMHLCTQRYEINWGSGLWNYPVNGVFIVCLLLSEVKLLCILVLSSGKYAIYVLGKSVAIEKKSLQ